MLTQHDVERLFTIVRNLRSRGAAIIYISHRLDEIFALADRVTVLRDGQWVATRKRRISPRPNSFGRWWGELWKRNLSSTIYLGETMVRVANRLYFASEILNVSHCSAMLA